MSDSFKVAVVFVSAVMFPAVHFLQDTKRHLEFLKCLDQVSLLSLAFHLYTCSLVDLSDVNT